MTDKPVAPPTRTHRGSITASCGHKLTDAEIEDGCGYPVRYKSGDEGVAYATYCAKCRDELMQTDDYLASDEAADDYINSLDTPSPAMTDVEKLIERLEQGIDSVFDPEKGIPEAEAVMDKAAAILRALAAEKSNYLEYENALAKKRDEIASLRAKLEEVNPTWKTDLEERNYYLRECEALRAKLERARSALMFICSANHGRPSSREELMSEARATLAEIADKEQE